MVTVYDITPDKLIREVAEELKSYSEITPPTWAPFVKTGVHKELPPDNPDWWYVRSASVLRKVYMKGPIGTQRLKAMYGGRKNRGSKQEKSRTGSGSIARNRIALLARLRIWKRRSLICSSTLRSCFFATEIISSISAGCPNR